MIDYKAQGKANRKKGAEFERQTRKALIQLGFTVDKWTNNIDLENEDIIPAKANPFNRFNRSGLGFPDFVAFAQGSANSGHPTYIVRFIECKLNGILSKVEKQKMNFLMSKNHACYIAYKGERMKDVLFKKLKPFKFRKLKKDEVR